MKNSCETFGGNFENREPFQEKGAVIKEFKIEREKTELESNAIEIVKKLRENGYKAYIVGGYARDLAMSRIHKVDFLPHDVDIATSAKSDEIGNIFSGNLANNEATGKVFGVMRVKANEKYDEYLEVATFRKETGSKDGRRPDNVSFINSAAEDAKRRDFTINGMFYDPIEEKIIDYVGGLEDLKNERLKFIGNPKDRIMGKKDEPGDNLRLLRAVRFKNRFGFDMPEKDWQAIKDNMKLIYKVSGERIQEELNKILMHQSRAEAMEDLYESGFFKRIIPEMRHLKGTKQPEEFHKEGDVWSHTVKCLKNIPEDAPKEVVWAVLLHDIGKPIVMKTPERHGTDRIHFDAHEKKSASVVETRLGELKFSNEEIDKIKWLAANHMVYNNFPKMGLAKKRRLMQHKYFPDLLKVMRADVYGSELLNKEAYDYIIEEWKEEQSRAKQDMKEPLLNGKDVMEQFGLDPKNNKEDGRKIGEILEKVKDAQLEGLIKTKDEAAEFAKINFGG